MCYMSSLFPNHSMSSTILKHKQLPVYITDEFVFYRCVCFDDNFYGKTVSKLHKGNLRKATPENRYSKLFFNEKISYWADSLQTARAEVKYHNHTNNLLTFWAYDDATSTFLTIDHDKPLIIMMGGKLDFIIYLKKLKKKKFLLTMKKN